MNKLTAFAITFTLVAVFSGCEQAPQETQTALTQDKQTVSAKETDAPLEKEQIIEEATPPVSQEAEQQSVVVEQQPEATPQTASESAPPTVTASEQAPVQEQQPAPTSPPPAQTPQPEPPPLVAVEPPPAQPSRPAFDAGAVISGAAAQISGFMTRESGTATGMGWFTFSFSVYDSTDKMIADLTAVMRQEHDLYGNVWFDLEYLGESGGYHTFKCYRA